MQTIESVRCRLLMLLLQRTEQQIIHIRIDDFWMHITFPAYRWRIAKMFGSDFDSLCDILFRLRLRLRLTQFFKGFRCENGTRPGAKIFGGKVLPRHLLQVVIDVTGLDSAPLSIVINVLKEFVTRQILTTPNNVRQSPVAHGNGVLLATFAAKMKTDV